MNHDPLPDVPHALGDVIAHAAACGASDVHIHSGHPVQMRRRGELKAFTPPVSSEDVRRWITQSGAALPLSPYEKCDLDHAMAVPGTGRVRVNAFLTRGEPAMVLRIIKDQILTLEELQVDQAGILEMMKAERGLILVTGPTGSGKTTTLAAIIDQLNRSFPGVIVTLEDPIEVMHPNHQSMVAQREVGRDTANFASGVRAALRQDPDVILIGEMRDSETVEAALKAAATGHLVLSTLHTQDAPKTINRILDFFPPHAQQSVRASLSEALVGVVSQRLIPKSPAGRACVLEVMVGTDSVNKAVLEGRITDVSELMAKAPNMQTFDEHLAALICSGTVLFDDAISSSSRPADLRSKLQEVGLSDSRARALQALPHEARIAELRELMRGTKYEHRSNA